MSAAQASAFLSLVFALSSLAPRSFDDLSAYTGQLYFACTTASGSAGSWSLEASPGIRTMTHVVASQCRLREAVSAKVIMESSHRRKCANAQHSVAGTN